MIGMQLNHRSVFLHMAVPLKIQILIVVNKETTLVHLEPLLLLVESGFQWTKQLFVLLEK